MGEWEMEQPEWFSYSAPQRCLGGLPWVGPHLCLNRDAPLPTVFHFCWGFASDYVWGEDFSMKTLWIRWSPVDLPAFPFGLMTSGGLGFIQCKPKVPWSVNNQESLGLDLLKRPKGWVFPQKQIPTGLPFPAKPTSHIRCPVPSHSPAYVPFL